VVENSSSFRSAKAGTWNSGRENSLDLSDEDDVLPTIPRLPDLSVRSSVSSVDGGERDGLVAKKNALPSLPKMSGLGVGADFESNTGMSNCDADAVAATLSVNATAMMRVTHDVSDSDCDKAGQGAPRQQQVGCENDDDDDDVNDDEDDDDKNYDNDDDDE
jgi:hypothetical protein